MPAPEHPRQAAFDKFSKAVDGPLTILALAMIPLLVIPVVVELSPSIERGLLTADYFIWAIFASEYATKVYLVPNRGRYVRTHVPCSGPGSLDTLSTLLIMPQPSLLMPGKPRVVCSVRGVR